MNTPKPAELLSQNSHRRDEREKSTPIVQGVPVAPSWLLKDSKEWFDSLNDELSKSKIAKQIDSVALGLLSDSVAEYINICKIIETDGRTISGRDGGTVKHPLLSERAKLWQQILMVCKEFGQTPVSRARIAAANEQTKLHPFFQRD